MRLAITSDLQRIRADIQRNTLIVSVHRSRDRRAALRIDDRDRDRESRKGNLKKARPSS
jgi:hypothetical protein